jgi:hypothetical protein
MVPMNGRRPHDGVLLTRDHPTSASLPAGRWTAARGAVRRAAGIWVALALVLAGVLASAASPSSPSRPANPYPSPAQCRTIRAGLLRPMPTSCATQTVQWRLARHLERDPLR